MVLCLPAIASAQYGGYGNNGGYNNGGYGNYGGYGNGGYNNGGYGDMRSTVRDLKNRARDFQRQIDRDLDNSRYNGSRREDEMNNLAQRFHSAVNNLDSNGYRSGGYGNNDNRMQEVFNLASQIERSIGRARLSYQSQNLWQGIRGDLQVLGRGYNGGGYNNGRGNGRNSGGWNNGSRNGLPSWWPF
jgi:hypothetical protein